MTGADGQVGDGSVQGTRLFYAHSRDGQPPAQWELLADHLACVADLAAEFAAGFDAREWGCLAGRYHDVGKFLRSSSAACMDRMGASIMRRRAQRRRWPWDQPGCPWPLS